MRACSLAWAKPGHKPGQSNRHSPHAPKSKAPLAGLLTYRGGRTRTCNPRFWRPVLCQLSYAPGLRPDCSRGLIGQ